MAQQALVGTDVSQVPTNGMLGTLAFLNLADVGGIAKSKTPASATAPGLPGEVCWDSGFIYICIAANTWKRAAISTWP